MPSKSIGGLAAVHDSGSRLGAALVLLALATAPAWAQGPANPRSVVFSGDIVQPTELSAVGAAGNLLFVAADEEAAVQVLAKDGDGYKVLHEPIKVLADGLEADLEGLAVAPPRPGEPLTVFAIGCHCRNRKQVKPDKKLAKNRERLLADEVEEQESRAHVFRLTVDPQTGEQKKLEMRSLAAALDAEPLLQRFRAVPSKENGVDIEGLALGKDGRLWAGFRGPVLRGNFVPVLGFDFTDPAKTRELRFVRLGGLGIRDLAAVEGGFLVLAGPVGDGVADYRIFFWNGSDDIPGKDSPAGASAVELAQVNPPSGEAKAEGLSVLRELPDRWEVLLLFDGVTRGGPQRLEVKKKL